MKHLKIFWSTEFFFVIFLFSGAFKESVTFPIDVAAFFLSFSAIGTAYRFVKNPTIKRWQFIPIFLFTGLFAILLFCFIFTPFTNEGVDKLIKFTALTLPTIFLPLIFINSKDSLNRILISIAILTSIISILSIPMILNPQGLFIGFNDGNYMGLARLTGIGFIALSYFLVISERKHKPVLFLLTLLTAIVLLSTGSRMPLIAIAVASIYLISKLFVKVDGKVHIRKKALYVVSLIILMAVFVRYFYLQGMFDTIVYRFDTLMGSGGGGSVSARIERYRASLNIFNENPFIGAGPGNFGLHHNTSGVGAYSHNIFFELISEAGLLGGLWFLVFTIIIVFSVFKVSKDYSVTIKSAVIIGFLYFFMNSMVSGDINDNRSLFFFAIILLYMTFEKGYSRQRVTTLKL